MFYLEDIGNIRKEQGEDPTFFWLLPNFLNGCGIEKEEYCICSPLFSCYDSQWRLVIIKNSKDEARCNILKPHEIGTTHSGFNFSQPINQQTKEQTTTKADAVVLSEFNFGVTVNQPKTEQSITKADAVVLSGLSFGGTGTVNQPKTEQSATKADAVVFSGFNFSQPINQQTKEQSTTKADAVVLSEFNFGGTVNQPKTEQSITKADAVVLSGLSFGGTGTVNQPKTEQSATKADAVVLSGLSFGGTETGNQPKTEQSATKADAVVLSGLSFGGTGTVNQPKTEQSATKADAVVLSGPTFGGTGTVNQPKTFSFGTTNQPKTFSFGIPTKTFCFALANQPKAEQSTSQPVRVKTTQSRFSFVHTSNQSKIEQCITQPRKYVRTESLFSSTNQYKKPGKLNHNQFGLFIWKAFSSDSKHNYVVWLKLCGLVSSYEGKLDSDGCFGKWNFFNREDIQPKEVISVNGFLKIICKIQLTEEIPLSIETDVEDEDDESKDEVTHDISEIKGVDRLVKNLEDLLHDGHNSDVVLKVEEREFRVHKAILAARSPVFASMFQHEMAEKGSGEVNIPDCTPESFDRFLRYIYTGRANTMSTDTVYNLYYAADKYHVEDLKKECIEYMTNNLSVDNFCDTIALSLQHSESKLQKAAICFFCKNIKKIVKTVQWQKYMSENSIHANELIIKALNA